MDVFLKPCPFCGYEHPELLDENEIEGNEDEGFEEVPYYAVNCPYNHGGCGATSGYRPTKDYAANVWNGRVG